MVVALLLRWSASIPAKMQSAAQASYFWRLRLVRTERRIELKRKLLLIPAALLGVTMLLVASAPGSSVSANAANGANLPLFSLSAQGKDQDQSTVTQPLTPVGSGFTYHGLLKSEGAPASGP